MRFPSHCSLPLALPSESLFIVYFPGQSLSWYNAGRTSNLTASQMGGSRYAPIQGCQTLQDRTLSFKFYKKRPHSVRSIYFLVFLPPNLCSILELRFWPPPGEYLSRSPRLQMLRANILRLGILYVLVPLEYTTFDAGRVFFRV